MEARQKKGGREGEREGEQENCVREET